MDIAIIETLNGGDLQKAGNDLAMVFGIENMPYLAMFGGNTEQSTKSTREKGEQGFDWWGNKLLMPDEPSQWMNSLTERTLRETALTTSGRVIIENAIKKDLEFLSPVATIEVNVQIIATDRLDITIRIIENERKPKMTIIKFQKLENGDYYLFDYSSADYYTGS